MRVWWFPEITNGWIIDYHGTPWFVKLPSGNENRYLLQRKLLHTFPDWESEIPEVANVLAWRLRMDGATRPTDQDLMAVRLENYAARVEWALEDGLLRTERAFTSMQPIGWWRPPRGERSWAENSEPESSPG